MGETVEAIAYKTDLPSRARDNVNDRIETIKGKVSDTLSSATGALSGAAASAKATVGSAAAAMPSPNDGLRNIGSAASANPLGLAIGALAVGFLVGLCLPVSDIERERVGRIGEQMTEQAKSAAAGAIEQGKAAVTQAIGDAISGTSTQTSSASS
jgi:hypothetical protein